MGYRVLAKVGCDNRCIHHYDASDARLSRAKCAIFPQIAAQHIIPDLNDTTGELPCSVFDSSDSYPSWSPSSMAGRCRPPWHLPGGYVITMWFFAPSRRCFSSYEGYLSMIIQDSAQLLEMMRGYQVPCILAAAVDLDLFEKLAPRPAPLRRWLPQPAATCARRPSCSTRWRLSG